MPVPAGRASALLAILSIHLGSGVSREQLRKWLWPEEEPESAAHALQVYVSKLRSLANKPGLIVADGSGYVLQADPGLVDLHCFSGLVRDAEAAMAAGDWGRALRNTRRALRLWRGEPAAGAEGFPFIDDWRARLRTQKTRLYHVHVEALIASKAYAEAALAAEDALQEEPTAERLWGALVRGRYFERDTAGAADAIRRAFRVLAEHGLTPGTQLRRLQHAVLRDDAAGVAGSFSMRAGKSPTGDAELLALIDDFVFRVRRPDPAAALLTLEQHRSELEGLLRRTTALGRQDVLLSLVVSVRTFWLLRGNVHQGLVWLKRATDENVSTSPTLLLSANHAAAELSLILQLPSVAGPHIMEAYRHARDVGDETYDAWLRLLASEHARLRGQHGRARKRAERALNAFSALEDDVGAATALAGLATQFAAAGRAAEATAHVSAARAFAIRSGYPRIQALVELSSAHTSYASKDEAASRNEAGDALAVYGEMLDAVSVARATADASTLVADPRETSFLCGAATALGLSAGIRTRPLAHSDDAIFADGWNLVLKAAAATPPDTKGVALELAKVLRSGL